MNKDTTTAAATMPAPLRVLDGRVAREWIDYNGHMTEARYLAVFSQASDVLLTTIGAGPDYVASGHSYYTAETHIIHRRELREGAPFYITAQVLGADAKRLHIWQVLYRARDGAAAASCEQMLLHVDAKAGRVCPALPHVRARLDALAAAHAALPRPAEAGRGIRLMREP
jgi:carnitine 3-dehydrogenase